MTVGWCSLGVIVTSEEEFYYSQSGTIVTGGMRTVLTLMGLVAVFSAVYARGLSAVDSHLDVIHDDSFLYFVC